MGDSEIEYLREIIEQDKHVDWFWSTVRVAATWITAVIAGGILGWDTLVKLIQHLANAGK